MGQALPPTSWGNDLESDPVMTSREAANLLGVSITTAQMWMETGMLASWKTPGGHRRTRRSAVLDLVRPEISDAGTNFENRASWEQSYPKMNNEAERAEFVENMMQLREPDPALDRITWLASEMLEMPISLVTFLTHDQQLFKARKGIEISETPRSWAFCNYSIAQKEVFTVMDATKDARFRSNPLVIAAPYIRFYAGIRLVVDNNACGSLCVIDTEPRILRSREKQLLMELGGLAAEILGLRNAN